MQKLFKWLVLNYLKTNQIIQVRNQKFSVLFLSTRDKCHVLRAIVIGFLLSCLVS